MRRIETYDWWPQLVELKDDLSLRELAEKFSVTPGAISAALRREGVTRKPAPPGPRAHRKKQRRRKAPVEVLPPEPGEVSRTPGAPEARPGSKDGQILDHWSLLGKVPDREVADLAGVSVRTVASFRSRHGIGAYSGPKRSKGQRRRRSKIEPFEDLLGKTPDQEVAELAGVTANAVRNFRAKRGIAAFGGSRRAAVALAATSGRQAWKVVYQAGQREVSRVVLADSLVAAAQTASASASGGKSGRVVSVTWVGELI